MLSLVLVLTFLSQEGERVGPRDIFVGGGINFGTGFTDTKVNRSTEFGLQAYPFSYQKFGFSYDFRFSSPDLSVTSPFFVEKTEREHLLGSSFRFSAGRFQPWIGGGVLFYSEKTRIMIFEELLAEDKQKKIVPFGRFGAKFLIWKNLFVEPVFEMDGTARPPWKSLVRTVWRF